MKQILLLLTFFNLISYVHGQQPSLEDIWLKGTYTPNKINLYHFLNGSSKHAFLNHHNHILSSSLYGNDTSLLFNNPHQLSIDNFSFSENNKTILFSTETERIYRRSSKANYFTFHISTKEINPVNEKHKQQYPLFSKDGLKLAYIVDNNLYFKHLATNKETQITFDGAPNQVINGASDWVYEEEFSITRAFDWSQDGRYIAYLKFDESNVREISLPFYKGQYPKQKVLKYPRAGEDNSIVEIWIYDTQTSTAKQLVLHNERTYIPFLKWNNEQLNIATLNRAQNHLKVLSYNLKKDSLTILYEETNNTYIELPSIRFLSDGSFLLTSEKEGYNHVYYFDELGNEKISLTKGNYDIMTIYGVDESKNTIFYQAAIPNLERHVFSHNFKTDSLKKLSFRKGYNSAKFSRDWRYMINTYSSDKAPPMTSLINLQNGKEIKVIRENKKLKESISNFYQPKEFFKIQLEEYKMDAWMIKPSNFDSTKSYPVLFYVYGGPGSQTVANKWGYNTNMWFQHLAQKGYIIVSVDNRGCGGQGESFKKSTYKQLGNLEVEDQIKAAKYISKWPFVNKERIGIYGWSYGGYLSLLCLFKGKGIFNAALSIAPVTHWKFYDTIYTERYMNIPKENKDGYSSSTPINFAKDWKEGSLFIAHGTADDNVHFQNTLELVKVMNNFNKAYDLYIYPNSSHGIGERKNRYHLFKQMTTFIVRNI